MSPPRIWYSGVGEAYARYFERLDALTAAPGVGRICEIGAGANPRYPASFATGRGMEYVLLDISAAELAKAPGGYTKIQADVTDAGLKLAGGYDVAFSFQLAEHVRSGRALHRNVHRLLAPGGRAIHFFPTLYALPFVLNRVLPEGLLQRAVVAVWPERNAAGRYGKFPAYYDWCRGPLPGQVARFESLGYEVEEYAGFFGHTYYQPLPPLQRLADAGARVLRRHPVAALTSFAYVVLRKPG